MGLLLKQMNQFGATGLNTDGPWSVDPGFLTDGKNFRIQNDQILSNNGLAVWAKRPEFSNTGEFLQVGDFSEGMYLFCTTKGLYSFDGKIWSLLNTVDVADPVSWTSCMNGSIPVVNHPAVGAFYWFPIGHGIALTPLPFNKTKNWDKNLGKSGRIIRSHKNYMFMLGITEVLNGKTQIIEDGYHWSHPSDVNSVPPSWDETDKNFLAGIAQLGGNMGRIIDGRSMRDSFVIYSQTGINLLTESNDIFVWSRTPVTSTTGPIADACVVEVMGNHFILAPDDLLVFDGNAVRSIAQGKIRDQYRAYINPTDWETSYAFKVVATKEVWFCVPGHGFSYPSMAFIYNWVEDAWSQRELPENMTYAIYGPRSRGQTLWESLAELSPPATWETFDAPWGNDSYNPFDETVIGIQLDGTILDCDSQYVGVDSVQGPVISLVRDNLPLGDTVQFTTIVGAYPKIDGVGTVMISLGSHDYPNAPTRWKPAVPFVLGKQRKINVRTTGALHAFKVESVGNCQFTMSGMDIEYAPAGLR